MAEPVVELMDEAMETALQLIKARAEITRLRAERDSLFAALREMAEWWAYAMDKPPGAQPDAEDHKKVEQLASAAINALHAADPTYVHRLPSGAH